MSTLVLVLLGQVIFAVVVLCVLKKLLDRELMSSALEKFESCSLPPEISEICVYSASPVSDEFKSRLESVRKRKFAQASLKLLENAELKGGVVIAAGELVLDFSLAGRLQKFWS